MKKLLLLLFGIVSFAQSMENVGKELVAVGSIVGTSVAAASLYGIANAELSIALCPEYFSQGGMLLKEKRLPKDSLLKHFLNKSKDSPKLKAAIWGVTTSWWMGLIAGIPLAMIARIGSSGQLDAQNLIKPVAVSLGITATSSLLVGWWGRRWAQNPIYMQKFKEYNSQLINGIPEQSEVGYVQAQFNTMAGYRFGAVSSLGLLGYSLFKRLKGN